MPTIECCERKINIDYSKYPCKVSHRSMLNDLLALFDEREIKSSHITTNLMIAILIGKICKINFGFIDDPCRKRFSSELGIIDFNKLDSKIDNFPDSDVTKIEELISIIFQTRSLRAEGHVVGLLGN